MRKHNLAVPELYAPRIAELMAQPITADDLYEFGCWMSERATEGERERMAEILRLSDRKLLEPAAVQMAWRRMLDESREGCATRQAVEEYDE